MATCPNKNTKEWKTLVSAQGEDMAYYLWDKFDGNVPEEYNTSLQEKLVNGFLKDQGVTVTEYNNLKEDLGLDAVAASDLVTKAIAYQKGESILPETAYFAYSMLGKQNNKIRSELRYLVNKWDKYKERFNHHSAAILKREGFIPNSKEWKNKIRDLVILDFLMENLEKQYIDPQAFEKEFDTKWTREDFALWQKFLSWLEDVLSSYSSRYKSQKAKLENIGRSIADEVLNKNYEYYNYALKEDQIRKYYKDTIESDQVAKGIVETGQKIGMILTGSLALRRAGEVYRTASETVHDIDWVIPYELNVVNNKPIEALIDPVTGQFPKNLTAIDNYLSRLSWYKQFKAAYPTYKVINGFYGAEHKAYESVTVQGVIDGEFYDSMGFHTEDISYYKKDPLTKKPVKVNKTIRKFHKKGDWKKDTGYVIDFFVRLAPRQEEHENYFKLWKEIMIAKLQMGRDKDFIDWKAFAPYTKSRNEYNFNYEGYRHFNYDASKVDAFEEGTEIQSPEDQQEDPTLQLEEVPASKSSPELIRRVKLAAEKMGINIQQLVDYARSTGLKVDGVNGVADLVRGIIAVAEGKEEQALTEEMVHIATAILEQTHPEIITEMISQIGKFKIYTTVFDAYSKDKRYQLPNGKPNIRKIKKEAVDKLITELIVKQNDGNAQYPDLLEPAKRTWLQNAWEKVLDFFRIAYKKANISVFEEVAAKVITGDVSGTVVDIQAAPTDIYLQKVTAPQEKAQKRILETQRILERRESQEKPDPMFMDTEEASNWYEILLPDGTWERVKKRVTDRVKQWYEQRFRGREFSAEEKEFNNFKREHGITYHGFVENIHGRYFNSDGTRRANPGKMTLSLDPVETAIYSKLEDYFVDLMDHFSKEGKTPLIFSEVKMYDPILKEAGTIDLLIIDEKGKGHIFDWKFMSVAPESRDVAWYKQGAYNIQLGRYKEMLLKHYGIKEIGMNRAIPIIMDVRRSDPKDRRSEIIIKGIKIGSINPAEIEDLTLLPVSEETESTYELLQDKKKAAALDAMIRDLNAIAKQIGKQDVTSEEERQFKSERINLIKAAIRAAQGKLDLAPLIETIETMRREGDILIAEYENNYKDRPVNAKDFNNKKLSDFADRMREYRAFAQVFGDVAVVLGDLIYTEGDEKNATSDAHLEEILYKKEVLYAMTNEATRIRRSSKEIEEISKAFADKFIGMKNLVKGLLLPEAEVKGLFSYFRGVSELPTAALQILFKIVTNAKARASQAALADTEKLLEIRKKLVERGGNVRDLVKQIYQKDDKGRWVNRLIRRFDKKFYDDIDKNAVEGERDLEWLKNQIDVEAYQKEADEVYNSRVAHYEALYEDDPDKLDEMILQERKKWKLDEPGFNGWNNYIIKRHALPKWESQEYKDLKKDPDLFELYNFISNINKTANEAGYLSNRMYSTFIPYVRKTMAESLAWDFNTTAISNALKSLEVSPDDVGYGSFNEITNELEHSIPKYYTHDFTKTETGENDYSDVSEDLFKNMILYINHMQKYKYLSEVEGQVKMVQTVEQFKNHLNTSRIGNVIPKDSELGGNEKNSRLFDDFLRALFYEQKYPLSDADIPLGFGKALTFAKQAINLVLHPFFGRDIIAINENPSASSMLKLMDAANRAFQVKTLGLEAISGAVNIFGGNIQVATQAGGYFDAREFLKNELDLIGNRFKNNDERKMFMQLIDLFMPLKDDPTYERLKEAGLTGMTQHNFTDWLMVFMREPEQHLEKSIFKTLLENTMIEDGKIVGIKEYVKAKYPERYRTPAEFKEASSKMKEEIATLKKTRSINAIKKLEDGKLVIPGLDLTNRDEIQKLTNLTRRISRNATGALSDSDMNRMGMNIWTKSMMVFKNWIPKLVDTRFSEFRKVSDDFSVEIDEDGNITGEKYDIGRIRLWFYVMGTSVRDKSMNVLNILKVNQKGLEALDKMYEDFSRKYEQRHGRPLEMTREDFIDMIRTNLRNQMKELAIAVAIVGANMALGFITHDPDDDKADKNRFRWYQRTLDRFASELLFFYNPMEFQKLLTGSMFPAIGLVTDIMRFFDHLTMEITGYDSSHPDWDMDKVRENAQPIKNGARMFPGAKASMTYLSILDAEFAKEFDITIQKESRRW